MRRAKSKPRYVLDTYAILTYFKEEPGWQQVRDILWASFKRENTVYLNYVNLGELYYIIYRENGPVMADKAINMIKHWPVKLVSVREELAIIAGRIKAENRLSYADAYVVATALIKRGIIATGDQEFKPLEDVVDLYWLPKNK